MADGSTRSSPGDLGELDKLWAGWTLRAGQLHDSMRTNTLGFTPSQVRALPYTQELVHALRIELAATKDQLHQLELMIGEHGAAEAGRKLARKAKRAARTESQNRFSVNGYAVPRQDSGRAASWGDIGLTEARSLSASPRTKTERTARR